MPLMNSFFEIQFVEDQGPFFQLVSITKLQIKMY